MAEKDQPVEVHTCFDFKSNVVAGQGIIALGRRLVAQAALSGVNAAVVGLLLAAFYDPVWTSGILSKADFGLAAVAFLLLLLWRVPPWLVVVICAVGGQLLALG